MINKTEFFKRLNKRNWFSSLKLKHKVRYLFLIIIGIYFIMFFIIYSFVIKKDMLNYRLENNLNMLESAGNNLNAELDTINNMSQLIMTNKDIANYLKYGNKQELIYSQDAVSSIYDITNIFYDISSVFIFKLDGSYVNSSRGITRFNQELFLDSEWKKEILEKKGGYILRLNGGGAFATSSGEPVISFIRLINDLETQKPIGILSINLSINMLEKTYRDMQNSNTYFEYYDTDNESFINEPNENLQNIQITEQKYFQKVNGNENIVSFYRVPNTSFIITAYEELSFGESVSEEVAIVLMVVLIVTSIVLILVGVFISQYITNPIERLVQSMDSVKTGWLRRLSLQLADDEIGDLKNSYNAMIVEINELINKLIEKEKSIQKAELDVLQEQIKPHFLYNTLDTISYLALTDSKEKVYEALETLGSFYRKFLSKGSKDIRIDKEVEIVKDYLKLQKLRYKNIFEDTYELQDDLLEIHIPKLILQPLVENSLYHGVRLKGEKGIIKISVFSKNNFIHIVIYDSGIGMSKKQIDSIMNSDDKKSFGFKGTIERIQYYYEREDVYEIRSKEGEYTEIDLKIPYKRRIFDV
ncbi:MAG: sensor histidine kinase [Eubacteriales bacterium]